MDQELKLLNILSENEKINQRAIAKEVGVSLGTVNSMLKNLEINDFIVISKTSNNAARYILTEEGKKYRSNKLLEYVIECSEMITKTRGNLKNALLSFVLKGTKCFYLSEGEDEFHRILTLILMEISRKYDISFQSTIPEVIPEDGLILGWKKENVYLGHNKYVHVINRI